MKWIPRERRTLAVEGGVFGRSIYGGTMWTRQGKPAYCAHGHREDVPCRRCDDILAGMRAADEIMDELMAGMSNPMYKAHHWSVDSDFDLMCVGGHESIRRSGCGKDHCETCCDCQVYDGLG